MPKQCNVPGCEKPAKTRGLCNGHYSSAVSSKSSAATAAKYTQYMDPSKRKHKATALRDDPPPAPPAAGLNPDRFSSGKSHDESADRLNHDQEVAAINAFAKTMGFKCLHFEAGTLFVSKNERRAVWLDRASGKQQEAQVLVGPSKIRIV